MSKLQDIIQNIRQTVVVQRPDTLIMVGDLVNWAFLILSLGAAASTCVFTYNSASAPKVDEARIFQRGEGKPAVMRTYKFGSDGLLVQDMKEKGKYIPLSQYLDTIVNQYGMGIEEAEIKRAAEWHK